MALEDNNMMLRVDRFSDLSCVFEAAAMGYLSFDEARVVQKFARFTLNNNELSLCSSFNNLNPFIDTPTELFLVSSSASDSFDVRIEYIDQNRDMQSEIVTVNGQTPVTLGTDIYCVFRMINVGSANQVGRVSITSDPAPVGGNPSDIVTFCEMPIDIGGLGAFNESSTGIFSIPRGFTGFFINIVVGTNKNADVSATATFRQKGGVFRVGSALDVYQTSRVKKDFTRIPSETDIRPVAIAQTGGDAFFEYDLVLIKNELLDRYL